MSEAVSRDDALRTVPLDTSTRWWWLWEALTLKLLDIRFRGSVKGKPPESGYRLHVPWIAGGCSYCRVLRVFTPYHLTIPTQCRRSNRFLSGEGDVGRLVLQHRTISPKLVSITWEPVLSHAYRSWPGNATPPSDAASHVDVHDDIAMNAIQTSLAVLMTGSSLASKLPFIAPIAGLLLQALTMRDARVPYISSDNGLTCTYLGSEAMQRGMRDSDAQTRQNREDHCRFV